MSGYALGLAVAVCGHPALLITWPEAPSPKLMGNPANVGPDLGTQQLPLRAMGNILSLSLPTVEMLCPELLGRLGLTRRERY